MSFNEPTHLPQGQEPQDATKEDEQRAICQVLKCGLLKSIDSSDGRDVASEAFSEKLTMIDCRDIAELAAEMDDAAIGAIVGNAVREYALQVAHHRGIV